MNKNILTDKVLQQLVEDISLKYFDMPFVHQAYFNNRLKTTGGRYHLKTSHIDFNYKVYEKFGLDELIGVIKHELCHYHLHRQGLGYRHQDSDFKKLLKQVGGSRYVRNVSEKVLLQYECMKCRAKYNRSRSINTSKYCCGRCKGVLIKL